MVKQKLSEVDLNKPLTIICHTDEVEVVNDRPEVLTITPEMTLQMAGKFNDHTWALARADEDFRKRFNTVFPQVDLTKEDRSLSDYAVSVRHVVGLIICTNMAINTNRVPYWQYPETYLHPASQSKVAQLAIMYSKELTDELAATDTPSDPTDGVSYTEQTNEDNEPTNDGT